MSNLIKSMVEFIGTFILLSVIIKFVKQGVKWASFAIALALIAMILWGGSISGAHFNPAVTTMFYLDNDIDMITTAQYIVSQLLGAYAALLFYQITK